MTLSQSLAALDEKAEAAPSGTLPPEYNDWCDTAWDNRATIRAALALAEAVDGYDHLVPPNVAVALAAYRDAAGKQESAD